MEMTVCLTGRRSIRKYTGEPVDRAVIERIVAAAAYAPSWKNSQTARYIVVDDPALKERIAAECVHHVNNTRVIREASALVIVVSVSGVSGYAPDGSFATSKETHWESFDAGLAAEAFCLAAYAEGLGTLIMGIFNEEQVAAAAAVPEGQTVSALIALGHPADAPAAPKRESLAALLSYR